MATSRTPLQEAYQREVRQVLITREMSHDPDTTQGWVDRLDWARLEKLSGSAPLGERLQRVRQGISDQIRRLSQQDQERQAIADGTAPQRRTRRLNR